MGNLVFETMVNPLSVRVSKFDPLKAPRRLAEM